MKARILWIDGKRAESPPFVPGLRRKGYTVEVVSSGSEAIARLPDYDPDLVVLNASSMRTNGKRICRELRNKAGDLPVVVINRDDQVINGEPCANIVLVLPFTVRKLVNRITRLLPGVSDSVVHVGMIRLDMERKQVRCQGREAVLTPRLTHLLRILMEHAGDVLERERLFSEVWKTEYTGDTRTLDVHISWLRQAIEDDPRKPRFLKTIRGVGYRLDV